VRSWQEFCGASGGIGGRRLSANKALQPTAAVVATAELSVGRLFFSPAGMDKYLEEELEPVQNRSAAIAKVTGES
jgi:hypothetical protein